MRQQFRREAVPALVFASISGEVSHVDQSARTFQVHWLSKGRRPLSYEATFNTAAKTTYLSGSWTNMKNGIHVKVVCHLEGPNSDTVVANSVQILAVANSEQEFSKVHFQVSV
jgi:hypothetical protein